MKCKALKDGLMNKSDYIRAGEEFEAAKCPSWATPVNPPKKKKPEEASASSGGDEGEE